MTKEFDFRCENETGSPEKEECRTERRKSTKAEAGKCVVCLENSKEARVPEVQVERGKW